jgi:hypothetical protein
MWFLAMKIVSGNKNPPVGKMGLTLIPYERSDMQPEHIIHDMYTKVEFFSGFDDGRIKHRPLGE